MDHLQRLVSPVMSSLCYDELFIKFNFMHAACLKATLSKCLGYAIVAGSMCLRVPQILKILAARSGEGISIMAEMMMVAAVFGTMAYGYHMQFPISAYGDAYFLYIQSVIILLLILYYKRNYFLIALCTGIIGAFTALLFSHSLTGDVILWLNNSSLIFSLVSKGLQILVNFNNGSTGALSAFSLILQFAGTLARIFTSIQETGDSNLIFQYAATTLANGLLVAQLLYYWSPPKQKKL